MTMESRKDEPSFADMLLQLDPLRLCLIVGIPFVATFSEINFSLGANFLGSVEFAIMASLAAQLWLAWQRASSPLLAHLFLAHAALLFGLLYFVGGFGGIGFIWSLGFPFIACFVVGSIAGGAWSICYLLGIVGAGLFVHDAIVHTASQVVYLVLAYLAMSLVAYCAAIVREAQEVRRMRLEQPSFPAPPSR